MGSNFHTPWDTNVLFKPSTMNPALTGLDRGITYLRNVIIHCDGVIIYTKTTGVLAWSSVLRIHFNRADGQAIQNTVDAGNITLVDNEFAYVDLNEINNSVLTVAKATITTATTSNFIVFNRLVFGYRNIASDEFFPVYLAGLLTSAVFTDMEEPTGFVDRVATLSFVSGAGGITREFTITGNHDIYINGARTTKGTATIVIVDTTGIHWIYYNAAGVLSESMTQPGFNLPLVATVYWNTTTNLALLGEERHGIVMDWATHELLHYTVGVRYHEGLTLTADDTTFSVGIGEYDDEDINFVIAAPKTTCDIIYKNGAVEFEWDLAQTTLYKLNGANLRYNNGNNLADVPTNQYVAYWIFATNDTTTPIVSLMGQRVDVTIANARANNKYESLTLGTLPYQEMKLLYRVIFRNDATPFEEIQDLRVVSNLPAGTYVATDHGVLTGLGDDDHLQYIKHDLATAENDFLVASGTGVFVKKTLAEVKTLLGI